MSMEELRKVSTEELREIVARHKEWLGDESTGVRACLSNADLSGVNLSGANLARAILANTNLSGANLRDCNLHLATLTCADLSHADLNNAYLDCACLSGANIYGANLLGVTLEGARLPNGIYAASGCGSVNRTTYYDAINDVVICGCWDDENGNHLDSFKERVERVYKEFSEFHKVRHRESDEVCYEEYMSAIKFFESMRKLRKAGKER